jgi:hypothetical protein
MSEWQPIETAPREGTRVLIWDRDCADYCVGFWSPSREQWIENWWPTADLPEGATEDEVIAATIALPAFWMHLPEAPE